MSYIERKQQILALLEQTNSVKATTLSKILYASTATVRRDLCRLEEEGLIIRSHGRAIRSSLYADNLTPYDQRQTVESLAKKKIAETAIKAHVKEGDVVILDASSTSLRAVDCLKDINNIIVITSGIKTLVELMKTDVRFYSTGGLAINESSSFVGQTAINTLNTFNADVCFISCHGLSPDGFVTDTSERENDVRATMLKQSKRKVLLIDESKVDKKCWHNLCHISEFDDVYCNAHLPFEVEKNVKNFHIV